MNRIRDINGNETYLTYTTDSGQLYLSQISYNANVNTPAIPATHTVDFLLENRSDTNITLEAGFRVETRKRLSQITAKANGNPVRRYVLGYNYSASTSRSLLSSVTEYGSDDVSALPPLTFSYQGKPFEFEAQSIWPGVSSQGQTDPAWNGIQTSDQSGEVYVGLIDVDRDGLPDRVMRNFASPYNQKSPGLDAGLLTAVTQSPSFQGSSPVDTAKAAKAPDREISSDLATEGRPGHDLNKGNGQLVKRNSRYVLEATSRGSPIWNSWI